MASPAVVGPPPGLAPAEPRLPSSQNKGQNSTTTPNDSRVKYSRSFLLKLSGSPLVEQPEMPAFQKWFGDWESYTPRQGHANSFQHRGETDQQQGKYGSRGAGGDREQGGHGRHYGRVQHDDASGPMGEFSHSKSGEHQQQTPGNGKDGYLSGFQGVRRREGGTTADRTDRGADRPERHDRGDRAERGDGRGPFNKRYEDREGSGESNVPRYANDVRSSNSRFPIGGKNPFGQVSASGTFKPAGKDGEGRFPMGRMSSYNRDSTVVDEAGRPIRIPRSAGAGKEFSSGREQRRTPGDDSGRLVGAGDDEDQGDWETVVPRSPDAERKLARAGALADAASDWRRGPGSASLPKRGPDGAGPRGSAVPRGTRGDEGRRGGPGGSGAFPAWMAEEADSPSWMEDNTPSASAHTLSGERKERGKLVFDAFKGSEIHATPLEGEDSIQAFKREMREREKRAREKEESETGVVDRHTASQRTSAPRPSAPPGLSKPSDAKSSPSQKEPEQAYESKSPVTNGEPSSTSISATGPPPGLSSDTNDPPSLNTLPPSVASTSVSGGRGSSRFARFFDGAAATNKAKEAQERALAALAQGNTSVASPAPSGPNSTSIASGPSTGMEALFQNMMMNHSQVQQTGSDPKQSQQRGESADSPTTARSTINATEPKASEADQQSMSKIMALLRGEGKTGKTEGVQPSSTQPSSRGGGDDGVSSAAAAGLMAMLSGGGQASPSVRPQQQGPPSPQQQRPAQSLPPGLDPSRFSAHAHPPPGVTGRASPAPPLGIPPRAQSPNISFGGQPQVHRSQSPGVGFFDHSQQHGGGGGGGGSHHQRMGSLQGSLQHFVLPPNQLPPGFTSNGGGMAQSPGGTGRPPFDPRMLARPPPGLQGPAPPGMNGVNHQAMRSGMGGVGGAGSGRDVNSNLSNLLVGLPPHIQHQLMGLPPHVQHSILTGGGPGLGPGPGPQSMPPGMGPPPRGMPPAGLAGPPPPHSPYFHQQMLYGPGPGAAGSPQSLVPYGETGAGSGTSSGGQGMPLPPGMGGMPYYGGGVGGGGGPPR